MTTVEQYLAQTGGRRGCPHPAHRMALVADSPAALILPECAGRVEWLRARKEGIGGSEVGALVGVNEHETPFSIFNKKTRTTPDVELTGNPIEWGHRFEDAVAQKTAEMIGLESRFGGGLWADREKRHLRVTPDRFATRKRSWKAVGVVEAKTAGDDEHWESGNITATGQGTGSAPAAYQCQIQWQMGIIGLKKGWLGCHISNWQRDFYVVEVDFNPEWFAEMVHAADVFWRDNVRAGEPPMHDLRHPKTEELLKTLHPKAILPSTQLPDGTEEWLETYYRAKLAAEKANTDLDAAKNYFRMMTGDAGAAYLGEQKIVGYPEVSASQVDAIELFKRFPEVHAQVVTPNVDIKRLKDEFPEVAREMIRKAPGHRRLTISVPKAIKDKVAAES